MKRKFLRGRSFRPLISLFVLTSLLVIALSAAPSFAQSGTPAGNPPAGAPAGAPPDGAAPPGAAGESTSNPAINATCGTVTIDGQSADASSDAVYDSSTSDVSALCVINGGSIAVTNPTITKTGDTSSADSSSFYGLNAAVLVGSGSTTTLEGGTVTTDGAGTNGLFATGEGASIAASDLSIEAIGDGAHAVMATLGGALTLDNVTMYTTGAHSGAVATDRGSGTITVTDSTVTTTGQDSPAIYSTGAISATGGTYTATGAEAAVIEGSNSITLTDVDLSSTFADKWGVMIYQSFSGDAEGSEGVFTMTGGSLTYTSSSGPLFFITNATGSVTLSGVEVTVDSGILAQAAATDRWGTSGSNGGHLVLLADAQALTGNLVADSISTLDITLQNGSSLIGAINPDTAASAVSVTLDATSSWTVTADSFVTTLEGAIITGDAISNIIGGGHNVYYDATAAANQTFAGLTYSLVGGGELLPVS
ncbi:MAG: hypothetical protein U0670_06890 [Anaerolineae bacterium]